MGHVHTVVPADSYSWGPVSFGDQGKWFTTVLSLKLHEIYKSGVSFKNTWETAQGYQGYAYQKSHQISESHFKEAKCAIPKLQMVP